MRGGDGVLRRMLHCRAVGAVAGDRHCGERWQGHNVEGAVFPRAFFCNEVDETVIQNRITSYAAERGCDVADINIFNNEQVLLDIYSIPVPIPYVCCYREMQISGVLVKRPTAADAAAARAEAMKREMKELLKKVPVEEGK